MRESPRMSFGAEQLTTRIRSRFCPPEFATLVNVEADNGRYADAVSVNLWRSRGFAVTGFEVKTSRSDWLRELKDPQKAEACVRYCHRFYVVANEGIVSLQELPLGWGLMEPKGDGLRIIKESPLNANVIPLSAGFAVHLIRRAVEGSADRRELLAEYQRGHAEGIEAGKQRLPANHEIERLQGEVQRFEKLHAEFKERTGVAINDWTTAGDLIRIHKLHAGSNYIGNNLKHTVSSLRATAKTVEKLAAEFLTDEGLKPTENALSLAGAEAP